MVLRSLGSKFGLLATIAAVALSHPMALAETPAISASALLKDKMQQIAEPGTLLAEHDALSNFYASRDYQPVWYSANGPTPSGAAILQELQQAASWGLAPDDFKLSAPHSPEALRQGAALVAAELELSKAIIKYARQARGGRIADPASQLSEFLDRRGEAADPSDVMSSVAGSADPAKALLAYHPQHPQFQRLHDLYVRLGGPQSTQTRPNIPSQGPMLSPGARSKEIALLRERLDVKAASEGDAELYDQDLAAAVIAFQKANKLWPDGVVGPRTRRALQQEDATDRLASIVATMEKWRWMPRDLGKRHVLVNIPAYEINFMENGKPVLTERVVVGKPETPTPVFSKEMTSIVLKPIWSLPDSIKKEKLERSRSLESQGLVVKKGGRTVNSWNVDWDRANLSHYTVYQPSGSGNALGSVKFLFPNKFSVYLHDTPSKSLFQNEERAYSHGCIRLRNPLSVAQLLLDWDRGEGAVDVKRLVSRGPDNNDLQLKTPLPMHIGYFTVWVDDDGEAKYFQDIYAHLNRVTLALKGKWNAIDHGPHQDKSMLEEAEARPAPAASSGRSVAEAAEGETTRAAPVLSVPAIKPIKTKASFVAPSPSKHKSGGYVGDLMNSAFLR